MIWPSCILSSSREFPASLIMLGLIFMEEETEAHRGEHIAQVIQVQQLKADWGWESRQPQSDIFYFFSSNQKILKGPLDFPPSNMELI